MTKKQYLLIGSLIGTFFAHAAAASAIPAASLPRGARQPDNVSQPRRHFSFSDFGKDYADFKDYLNKKYGFD